MNKWAKLAHYMAATKGATVEPGISKVAVKLLPLLLLGGLATPVVLGEIKRRESEASDRRLHAFINQLGPIFASMNRGQGALGYNIPAQDFNLG
jgi:hypothetical protein